MLFRSIAEGAGLRPGQRALELGCGTGMFTEHFARSGASLWAVDISPDLLERARERGLPDHVTFVEGDIEQCGLPGPFDAVIGSSVLHHLNVGVALRRIFDLTRPGGVLCFAEPNYLNPQVYLERRFCYWRCFSYTEPHETAFVRWRLARELRRIGFVDVGIQPFDWLHPRTPRPMIGLVQRLGLVMEQVPGLREFSGSVLIRARRL